MDHHDDGPGRETRLVKTQDTGSFGSWRQRQRSSMSLC